MRSLPLIIVIASILLSGCAHRQKPTYEPAIVWEAKPTPKVKRKVNPKAKHIKKQTKRKKLKKVQDNNFNPEYMYPDTPKHTPKAPAVSQPTDTIADASSDTMSRETCIGMIGQEKFDKYTQMLGSESAAIKRCILLRSMK